METGSQVGALFMNFKKAYDTVNQGYLIDAFDRLEIGTSRRQFFSINGAHSDLFIIPSGDPQGGHLGPLFFIVFMNSLNYLLLKSLYSLMA